MLGWRSIPKVVWLDSRSTEYVFLSSFVERTNDQSPNAFLAYQEGGKVLQGLVDGSVCPLVIVKRFADFRSSWTRILWMELGLY